MSTAEIQQALANAGYDPGPIDGVSGPKTKAAIRAYQQAHGLAVDGVAGKNTQASLRGGGAASSGSAGSPPTAQQTFQQKYPQFSWAFGDGEVRSVLENAVAHKWGPDEVQGAIQNTNWWKTKSDAERAWLQTAATDPAEANKRMWNYDSITKYMGLANDYGIPMTFGGAADAVGYVVRGEVDASELTQRLRNQAKALYPQLAQQLDAGATVADVYAPYQQMASSLLGLNPADIKLSDPKWQTPLQVVGKDGNKRLATTDEWQTILRTDPKFGYDTSQNGRETAAQLTTSLGQLFGSLA